MNAVFSTWMSDKHEVPSHLKKSIELLSIEHISGIRLAQLDSPMMKQFKQAKEEVPDALLFFRMGDFFELFGLDAVIASDICDLTLTSRDKNQEYPVPMAGVPVVAYKNALKKCLNAGFKVAVCDQIEDPKFVKGIVKREITRIATPAVPGDLEDQSTSTEQVFGCYLASVIHIKNFYTFAYIDVSTGEFRLTSYLNQSELLQEISTIKPKEILVQGVREKEIKDLLDSAFYQSSEKRINLTKIDAWLLKNEEVSKNLFLEFFSEKDFHGFGLSQIEGSLFCVSSILHYLKATQKSVLKNIKHIAYYVTSHYLLLDESTKKNLDFFQTSTGEKRGSFFNFLNHCQTQMGARLLLRRLNYPFKSSTEIKNSLDSVEVLLNDPEFLISLRNCLSGISDLEKILSYTAQKSLDVKNTILLKNSLNSFVQIEDMIFAHKSSLSFDEEKCDKSLGKQLAPLCHLLTSAVVGDFSCQLGTGSCFFQKCFSVELDELCDLEQNFQNKLQELENFERKRSQISTLKIGFTRVFGYYFEISKGKLSQVPEHFERKQTLTNGERFVTKELKELEEKALSAAEKRMQLERELFDTLRLKILDFSQIIFRTAAFTAKLDLHCNFAHIAYTYSWCKPNLLNSNETHLEMCAHPVLKYSKTSAESFIANSVHIGGATPAIHLITGPNMAGKSTLMRTVALNQILFQMGSYVCAASASFGVADKVLSRIGSADHAAKNQSTFMVEMLEMAHILRLATPMSLLLLDEIGRGTSTYDGLSLALALIEDLHDTLQPRTFFSTHYHELVIATEGKNGITPMHMQVILEKEGQETKLIFSRKYLPGAAKQSYGLNVAALAGLPVRVVKRASEVLAKLEKDKGNASKKRISLEDQVDSTLF